ncbi:TonB-dependent receptor [Sphingobacterium sp. DR205]|uniref:TonB-dependent receptor n=1 Tax=Sphingobacterium sp. DR205 TaxID=2713573 RepID=UPI0013E50278|nr:TonB-dependent receptor [Sphingobacterium sp. DR205]QIH32968.1 SusC/RagA family TonB-linked outer membrane protein [Sphingobacterium sp. DR205]
MNKKYRTYFNRYDCALKYLNKTKVTVLTMLLMSSQVNANVFGQRVSLTTKTASLKEVFAKISRQSGYHFLYLEEDLRVSGNKISLKLENVSLKQALDKVLVENGLTYMIRDNRIIVERLNRSVVKSDNETVKIQKRIVKGTVSDDKGNKLSGVTVKVLHGTATATNEKGEFEIQAKEGDKIQFDLIGYGQYVTTIDNRNVYHVTLSEKIGDLQEVVVVGYGTQRKVNLTGAVATISPKQLENRPISSLSAGLQGLVPGMTITQGSGQPGKDNGTIRVRGVGTLNNSNPMVLVDGIESSMENVDPNDVESISVLKDAASASIYGSKAANGVILVTTKRGKEGKTTINYSNFFGKQNATNMAERLNSWEYAELYNEGLRLDGKKERFTAEDIKAFKDGSDPYKYPNTNWHDLLLKGSGFQHQHNLNISGGAEKVRYMGSVGYQGQDGIIKLTSKKQFNARTNLDMTPVKNLDIALSMYLSNRKLQEPTNPYVGGMGQYFRLANQMAPWIPYKDANGDYGTISDGNPIAWMEQGATTDEVQRRFNAIGSVQYKFMDGLSLKALGSYRPSTDDSHEFRKDIWYNSSKYQGPNKLFEKTTISTMYTGDITLNFDRTFSNHHIGALAGYHAEQYDYKYGELYRQNFPNNDLTDIDAGDTNGQTNKGDTKHLNMLSYFGRINYDYKGIYLFEANVRRDASSRFSEGYRWGTFPSFSAGWRLSEESFMEFAKSTFSNIKIRGSWGRLGNQSALEYYPSIPVIGLGRDYSYPFNNVIYPGATLKKANKRSITWEKTRTWDLGLDLGIGTNLTLTLDYYDRLTTDILMEVLAPATYGLKGYVDNVGRMQNKGFEAIATYRKRLGAVDFSATANFSYNKNRILDLGGDSYLLDGSWKIKQVGAPINSFYGYHTAGLFQSTEDIQNWAQYKMANNKVLPGDLRYVDRNGDKNVTADDRTILGSTDPKYTFGLNLSAAYHGFDIQAFFQGASGVYGYVESSGIGEFSGDTGSPLRFWLDRWTPDNPTSTIPRIQNNNGISSPNRIVSDYWVQNAKYVRLKNLQLGYTFPDAWANRIGASKVKLFYSGQNLLTVTKFLKGYDPEMPAGSGSYYPQVKVNTVGMNITF